MYVTKPVGLLEQSDGLLAPDGREYSILSILRRRDGFVTVTTEFYVRSPVTGEHVTLRRKWILDRRDQVVVAYRRPARLEEKLESTRRSKAKGRL